MVLERLDILDKDLFFCTRQIGILHHLDRFKCNSMLHFRDQVAFDRLGIFSFESFLDIKK